MTVVWITTWTTVGVPETPVQAVAYAEIPSTVEVTCEVVRGVGRGCALVVSVEEVVEEVAFREREVEGVPVREPELMTDGREDEEEDKRSDS